jgi:hypothetical protein
MRLVAWHIFNFYSDDSRTFGSGKTKRFCISTGQLPSRLAFPAVQGSGKPLVTDLIQSYECTLMEYQLHVRSSYKSSYFGA